MTHFQRMALLIALGVVVLTRGVRYLVETKLAYGAPMPILGNMFQLTRSENTGVAFSLLQGSRLVPWLSALALLLVALYLGRLLTRYLAPPWGPILLGLILGGGSANLLDRLGDGRVTDYFDFGLGAWRYATFNLPDVCIVVGIMMSMFVVAQRERHERI